MSCLFLPGVPQARADVDKEGLSPDAMPVTLVSGQSGIEMSIRPDGEAGRVQTCKASCTLTLTPGMYRVTVSGGGESSWRRIWIHESQRLILTPPDPGSRRLGAGLATSGAVIGGAGSVLTLYAMMKALSCSFGSRPEDEGNSGCPGRWSGS
jgi:hypothetical protein